MLLPARIGWLCLAWRSRQAPGPWAAGAIADARQLPPRGGGGRCGDTPLASARRSLSWPSSLSKLHSDAGTAASSPSGQGQEAERDSRLHQGSLAARFVSERGCPKLERVQEVPLRTGDLVALGFFFGGERSHTVGSWETNHPLLVC